MRGLFYERLEKPGRAFEVYMHYVRMPDSEQAG
jgi:hypothetical protein